MAAFCGCCGAEITAKAEACVVCGAPRHGMIKPARSADEIGAQPAADCSPLFDSERCVRE